MIRPATMSDFEAIFTICMEQAEMYENLIPDQKKIRLGMRQAISSAKHFCWVDEDIDGDVGAVLIGLSSDNLWAQRQNCFVALWYSHIANSGRKLLVKFKEWVESRRIIRVAGFVHDTDEMDQRVFLLLDRMGFKRRGGTYLFYN